MLNTFWRLSGVTLRSEERKKMQHIILLLAIQLLLQVVVAQVSFSYEGFKDDDRNNIILSGDASIFSSQLRLTADNFYSNGRAVKTQAITFCSQDSPLSFTSDFTFLIRSKGNNQNADGLAFFIAPSTKSPSNQSYGRWLTLLEPSNNGMLSNQLVAVEFDTYPNKPPEYPEFQDIDGNHVGVNVNGLISRNASSLRPAGIVLGGDSLLAARIDYDAGEEMLRVYVSKDVSFASIGRPVLEHRIKLCAYINSASYVGFSAGSGSTNVDFHNIYSWSFTSRKSLLTSRSSSSSKINESFKVPFIIAVAVLGLLLVFTLYTLVRNYQRDHALAPFSVRRRRLQEPQELVMLPHEMSYADIVLATHNFNEGNLLGSGGFGCVYKGILPEDSSVVAVKRVSEDSHQGEREFLAEVKIISSLSHRNLVKLRGWCRKKNEYILVYEFMPQGSVDQALFKNTSVLLLWNTRYKIIQGLAAAVAYLHDEWERQVLHRDIKCSNVMLDGDFNARLGDFGLARVVERENLTRTTTSLAGTLGYIAPEVGYTYKFTPASDVYSFGVVVLEMLCGKKVVSEEMLLLPWVEENFSSGMGLAIVDPRLHELYDPDEVMLVLKIAMLCVQEDPKQRPSMREVLHSLS